MYRRTFAILVSALMLSIVMALPTLAVTYTGSLAYSPGYPADSADGLFVGPSNLQWAGYIVGISWTVTNQINSYAGFPWKYTYTFGHNGGQAGISHIIIEGSQGINENNITGLTGAALSSVGLQTVLSGNPNMPAGLNGIRFNPLTTSPFSMTWSFWSDRAPVWGDFYARCGGGQGGINYAYNYNKTGTTELGFLASDIDPSGPAADGSLDYHILRPDTVTTVTAVPEPATLLGFGLPMLMVGLSKIRRLRK